MVPESGPPWVMPRAIRVRNSSNSSCPVLSVSTVAIISSTAWLDTCVQLARLRTGNLHRPSAAADGTPLLVKRRQAIWKASTAGMCSCNSRVEANGMQL